VSTDTLTGGQLRLLYIAKTVLKVKVYLIKLAGWRKVGNTESFNDLPLIVDQHKRFFIAAVNVLYWGCSLTYGECHSRKVGWLSKNQKMVAFVVYY